MPLTLVEIPRQSVAPYTDFNKPPGSEVFSCGEGIEMNFKEARSLHLKISLCMGFGWV